MASYGWGSRASATHPENKKSATTTTQAVQWIATRPWTRDIGGNEFPRTPTGGRPWRGPHSRHLLDSDGRSGRSRRSRRGQEPMGSAMQGKTRTDPGNSPVTRTLNAFMSLMLDTEKPPPLKPRNLVAINHKKLENPRAGKPGKQMALRRRSLQTGTAGQNVQSTSST